MTQTLHKNKTLFDFIAYYQIIGGLYGLYSITAQLVKLNTVSGLGVIVYLIIIGLYSFSIYCGNLVRLKKEKGLQITKWCQLTQLFQFNISGVAFWYISGFGVSLGYGKADDLIQFLYLNLSSMYFKYNLKDTEDFYFFINLIPIALIFLAEKLQKKIQNENKIDNYV
ncbi:hypothetical protein [Pedobacter namyangjuensis]|uniref:hypothetical protein n=1 Tax=Pedobacter namyangjuensis TaxID=600626 RepID=UPI000DE370E1|nr:hypothetical protein [Pedobacter namyangjuensis]